MRRRSVQRRRSQGFTCWITFATKSLLRIQDVLLHFIVLHCTKVEIENVRKGTRAGSGRPRWRRSFVWRTFTSGRSRSHSWWDDSLRLLRSRRWNRCLLLFLGFGLLKYKLMSWAQLLNYVSFKYLFCFDAAVCSFLFLAFLFDRGGRSRLRCWCGGCLGRGQTSRKKDLNLGLCRSRGRWSKRSWWHFGSRRHSSSMEANGLRQIRRRRGGQIMPTEQLYLVLANWKRKSTWWAGITPKNQARHPMNAFLVGPLFSCCTTCLI